jgi:hypothetical protein
MFAMLRGLCMPVISPSHARALGRAGLGRACLVALIGLVIEFALGMILNLYVMIPSTDATASYLREIETAPVVLTAHALLGLLLLGTAAILLFRAITLREMALITPAAAGATAILGAFAAGEVFVKTNDSSVSLSMAILTGVALVCYIGLQAILAGAAAARRPADSLWTGLDTGD